MTAGVSTAGRAAREHASQSACRINCAALASARTHGPACARAGLPRQSPDLGAFSAEHRATADGCHVPAVTTCGGLTCMPGIDGTDLPAAHRTPTRCRDTTGPGYRMSSLEHAGMADLGADGDPRTHRVMSKESALGNMRVDALISRSVISPGLRRRASPPFWAVLLISLEPECAAPNQALCSLAEVCRMAVGDGRPVRICNRALAILLWR